MLLLITIRQVALLAALQPPAHRHFKLKLLSLLSDMCLMTHDRVMSSMHLKSARTDGVNGGGQRGSLATGTLLLDRHLVWQSLISSVLKFAVGNQVLCNT